MAELADSPRLASRFEPTLVQAHRDRLRLLLHHQQLFEAVSGLVPLEDRQLPDFLIGAGHVAQGDDGQLAVSCGFHPREEPVEARGHEHLGVDAKVRVLVEHLDLVHIAEATGTAKELTHRERHLVPHAALGGGGVDAREARKAVHQLLHVGREPVHDRRLLDGGQVVDGGVNRVLRVVLELLEELRLHVFYGLGRERGMSLLRAARGLARLDVPRAAPSDHPPAHGRLQHHGRLRRRHDACGLPAERLEVRVLVFDPALHTRLRGKGLAGLAQLRQG